MEDMEDAAKIKLGHKSKRTLCVIPTLIFALTCFLHDLHSIACSGKKKEEPL
ncbi:MAG: hypothetical protein MJE68_31530 [Proteobacteria bacterium]|nr:hypothetical protein [Pseudomonadota bacterium]